MEQLLLRKLKPKGSFITRPRSALSTRPSRSDRGLIVGARTTPVSRFYLAGDVAALFSFDNLCGRGGFKFEVRLANDANGLSAARTLP